MLQQWFNRDVGRAKLLNLVPQNRPTQSTRSSSVANNEDGVSCGVLCAAQAYSYVSGNTSLKRVLLHLLNAKTSSSGRKWSRLGSLTERGLAILCAISAAPEYAMSAGIDGS
ncbi:hypothetical protein PC118_g21317 [Phytophthora cactorum]|uniref:Uncharacterized protein n=1 Tax=Phytophthora cactorum TaxID=29920 RepID=A0A8T1EW90_9STRA|nr:hypothetical protein PC112_g21520 [Phytophthora cactorum]KAG2962647.1 hypothetical protein PC118_g21317 [Phytophthora cactorum]